MLQFTRVVTGVVILAGVSACENSQASPAAPRPSIRISIGTSGSPSSNGRLIAEGFLKLPQFTFKDVQMGSPEERLLALQQGTLDVTSAVDDVAYRAVYSGLPGHPDRLDKIRGIAVLNRVVVHLVTGPNVDPSRNLKGLRIVLGSPTGTNSPLGEKLLQSAGISTADVKGEYLPYEIAVERLADGTLDAAIMTGRPPIPTVTAALRAGGRIREIGTEAANRLRAHYSLMKETLIPANTYPGQPKPVHTVSVAVMLVCRADLDSELVYELTRSYFEDLPESINRQTDPQRAPATVIPLHPGAARYYRERELRR